MAIRAIQFSPKAAPAGLSIGVGAMSGLNQGINNYARIHMQRMQMQANQLKAQSAANYQNARADAMNRQNQDVDFGKVQVASQLDRMAKTGQIQYDPDDSGKLVAHYTKQALNNLKTPQDVQAAQARLSSMQGTADSLNSNEQKYVMGGQTTQARQDVANTGADARVKSAQIYGTTRQGVADSAAAAKMGAAGIYTNTRDKDSQMKTLSDQINNTAKSLNPTGPMATQLDPEAKAGLQSHLNDLQNQYHSLSAGSSSASAPSATPKTLSADQWQNAQKGDIVVHPDGTKYQSLGGGNFIPAPQSPGAALQSPPQAAPQAQAQPGLQLQSPGAALGGN